jgi:hypothetical protein
MNCLKLVVVLTAILVYATSCSPVSEPIAVGPGRYVSVLDKESIQHPLPATELKEYERIFNSFRGVNNPVYRTIVGPNYRLFVTVLLPDSNVVWHEVIAKDTSATVLASIATKSGRSILFRMGTTIAAIAHPAELSNPAIALCYVSSDSVNVTKWYESEMYRQRIFAQ